jgi:hypothetical protein
MLNRTHHSYSTVFSRDKVILLGFTIKTTSFTPPSVIKLYLYVYTPLHVSLLSSHLRKTYQHCEETTIT